MTEVVINEKTPFSASEVVGELFGDMPMQRRQANCADCILSNNDSGPVPTVRLATL